MRFSIAKLITAKIRNQVANLAKLKRAYAVLNEIAERCATPRAVAADVKRLTSNSTEDQSLVTSAATRVASAVKKQIPISPSS